MEPTAWNFFEDILPPEIAELLFSFLPLEDIVKSISIVCKLWNSYFDAKQIWKKIFEHHYGELSPKSVDLTQNFNWRRIFIIFSRASRWAKTFPSTPICHEQLMWRYGIPEYSELGSSCQFIHTQRYSIDIKLASKIIHSKKEPTFQHDWLPPTQSYSGRQAKIIASNGKGKYLIEDVDSKCWYLYDSEQMTTTSPADHTAMRLGIGALDITPTYYNWESIDGSFNSRYVVLAETHQSSPKNVLFDLQHTCSHFTLLYKDAQKRKFHQPGEERCLEQSLEIPHGVLGVFASQLVPDKIVFIIREPDEEESTTQYVFNPKMVVWTPEGGLNGHNGLALKDGPPTPNLTLKATNFSEHVIDEYHWICFDMGNYTRIINLNNFAQQFKLDLMKKHMWVPNKNLIVLAKGNKVTVFDVQQNKWISRMTCPNEVRAITFNKSTRILFVADTQFIHAFHWETAKLIGSLQHPFLQQQLHFGQQAVPLDSIHIAYDHIIILNGSVLMRMPKKCDM